MNIKDHSQYGEQKYILAHFGERTGNFLSLGENDGQTLSMVRALALLGWGGVCVEPAPIPFNKLEALYANSMAVNVVNTAICGHDGEIDFWDSGPHLGNGDTSLLATTVLSEVVKWKGKAAFRKTTCTAMTFNSLITLCQNNGWPTKFDFISIDCEGQDWYILQQMDLRKLGCELLCIEGNLHTSPENADRYIGFMDTQGMRLKIRNNVNMLFERV